MLNENGKRFADSKSKTTFADMSYDKLPTDVWLLSYNEFDNIVVMQTARYELIYNKKPKYLKLDNEVADALKHERDKIVNDADVQFNDNSGETYRNLIICRTDKPEIEVF